MGDIIDLGATTPRALSRRGPADTPPYPHISREAGRTRAASSRLVSETNL